MSTRSSDSESSEVSSQSIQPMVDEVVMSMQYSIDPTPLLGGDVPSDHVVSQPIHPVVEKWSCRCNLQLIPLLFWGLMHL
jgi:hypothetical protein